MLVAVVPLVFAARSFGTNFPNGLTITQGSITSLTPTALTVQANGAVPTTCTRPSSSPVVAGFKVGEPVSIDCQNGVLISIVQSGLDLGLDITLIPGIPENPNADSRLPVPGPPPTQQQCAAAWNTTAPLASRQSLGADAPVSASVVVSSVSAPLPGTQLTVVQTGHTLKVTSPVATGPVCAIWFDLPGPRHAMVHGLWKDGSVSEWNGFIQHGFVYTDGAAPFRVSTNGTLTTDD
jgi:hypothetical protein